MIIAILNCDKNWGIGKKNGLLFHLPKDMKFFRDTTLNHVVALGEKTLLSFPNARPLKNRTHIVLSSDKTHNYENVINVHTLLLLVFDCYQIRFDIFHLCRHLSFDLLHKFVKATI